MSAQALTRLAAWHRDRIVYVKAVPTFKHYICPQGTYGSASVTYVDRKLVNRDHARWALEIIQAAAPHDSKRGPAIRAEVRELMEMLG